MLAFDNQQMAKENVEKAILRRAAVDGGSLL